MLSKQDLSKTHQLISNLFKWPEKSSAWEQYKLSNEQLDFFKEFGYLSNVKLLDEWQIDRLNKELEEIVDPMHPLNELFHHQWRHSP